MTGSSSSSFLERAGLVGMSSASFNRLSEAGTSGPHTGRLVQHVVLPDPIPLDTNGMVLDETGMKMFLISNTGITVAQLYQVPLSLAMANPASGSAGTSVTLRGSGFQDGATVTFGPVPAATVWVDSNTLKVTVPTLSQGPVRVAVSNPDGSLYFLDYAFSVT
jgi:hypothetical protein